LSRKRRAVHHVHNPNCWVARQPCLLRSHAEGYNGTEDRLSARQKLLTRPLAVHLVNQNVKRQRAYAWRPDRLVRHRSRVVTGPSHRGRSAVQRRRCGPAQTVCRCASRLTATMSRPLIGVMTRWHWPSAPHLP